MAASALEGYFLLNCPKVYAMFYDPINQHLLKVYHGPGTVKRICIYEMAMLLYWHQIPNTGEDSFVAHTLASPFLKSRRHSL